jgi:hypothetical protein
MRVEEQFQDVLQNIEFAIVQVYRSQPQMTDYAAARALEAAVARYKAVASGRPEPTTNLTGLELQVFEGVTRMCERRLGRLQRDDSEESPAPIRPEDLVECLKRLQKSVTRWTREGGRQGYLNFVSQFIR